MIHSDHASPEDMEGRCNYFGDSCTPLGWWPHISNVFAGTIRFLAMSSFPLDRFTEK